MVNPNEINFFNPSTDTTATEALFDAAIRKASENISWPAVVAAVRDAAVTQAAVMLAIQKYRDLGWIIREPATHERDCLAIIWHPDDKLAGSRGLWPLNHEAS